MAPGKSVRNDSPASRRLFFALWPSPEEQSFIYEALQPQVLASGGRRIALRNLHVTLAFLGQVPDARLADIAALAGRIGACGRINLVFERVEVWKRSRVLALVPRVTSEALAQLVERLQFNLLKEQFEARYEEYRPHMTLARDAKRRIAEDLSAPIPWSVSQFALVESKTNDTGAIYSVLHNWELIQ